ncbi:MAG TPA: FAD-dependent oxidoreductase, partial [Candidatus Thermoplasmatota archaeon]|nr:FAD-dependent oxidoreductase [Candidatus Thermoplasmatota archaeon]
EGAVRFDRQYHFHPRQYLLSVLEAATEAGAMVHESTPVSEIREGDPCEVVTTGGVLRARHVIVATNAPINEKSFYVMRMQAKREYVVVAKGAKVLRGMYVNCDEPRRSVRPYQGSLVFAGESHPVGKEAPTESHYEALRSFATRFGAQDVTHQWSTQDYYPTDDVPMVGRYGATSRYLWTATGFRAWGMTMGTAAAMMLTDLVTKGESPWSALYDPFRADRLLTALGQKAQYQLIGTAVDGLIGRRLKPYGQGDLQPGEGRVMDAGVHKVAVCRDRDGQLHSVVARCSHMGCIVSWNTAEQSWDCPCHGSRFAPSGAVLRGPATKPLEPAREPDATHRM